MTDHWPSVASIGSLCHLANLSTESLKLISSGEFGKHRGAVFATAVSPDSRIVASAGEDRVIRLWSVEDFCELRVLEGHDSQIYSVAFSPDNRTLLSGGWDKTMRLWDIPSGKCLLTLREHNGAVNHISIAPNGLTAVTACADSNLYSWDLVTGSVVGRFIGHQRAVISSLFLDTGNRLASISDDQTVRIWNYQTQSEEFMVELGSIQPACFCGNGDFLYIGFGGEDSGIKQINLETNQIIGPINGSTKAISGHSHCSRKEDPGYRRRRSNIANCIYNRRDERTPVIDLSGLGILLIFFSRRGNSPCRSRLWYRSSFQNGVSAEDNNRL